MVREHRLTTLVGAGGADKTRLAVSAASDAAAGFDGAWLVALGPLDDPTHLAGHRLTELGLVDQMDRPALDSLRGWIDGHDRLLVMDNGERRRGAGRTAPVVLPATARVGHEPASAALFWGTPSGACQR